MKQITLFSIGALLLGSTAASAQSDKYFPRSFHVGATGGYGRSWVDDVRVPEGYMPSWNIGVSVVTQRSRIWAWGASLLASAEGYRIKLNAGERTVRPVYLRLPIKGYFYFTKTKVQPMAYFGPQIGVKVSESSSGPLREGEAPGGKEFRNFDAGIVGGGGLSVRLSETKRLTLDAGYYKGFSDANQKMVSEFNRNSNWTINVGMLFQLSDNRY
jgi:hypothetical protein